MAEHNRKTVKHVTRSKNTKKSEGEIKKADVIRVIVCAVLLIAVHFLPTNGAVRFITFFAVYLASGYDVIIRAGSKLINREFTDECLLMTIASAGALCDRGLCRFKKPQIRGRTHGYTRGSCLCRDCRGGL